MRLAARWRWQLEGIRAAGWEVIARAGLYIARLADTEISGSVAGWLLRSVERDLIDDAGRARRTGDDLAVDDPTGDTAPLIRHHQAPSAEDAAFGGPLVWGALCDATRRGALSSASARVVLLHAVGHSLPTSPDKAHQLHIAACMVRIVQDIDGWLGECATTVEHGGDGTQDLSLDVTGILPGEVQRHSRVRPHDRRVPQRTRRPGRSGPGVMRAGPRRRPGGARSPLGANRPRRVRPG